MGALNDVFRRQTHLGDPVTVGDVTITPQSQAVTARWPGGGWTWQRPIAVLVARDGETERIPIVDVTRMVQLGLLGLSVVLAVLTAARALHERKRQHE
jgi:hypothetical protein